MQVRRRLLVSATVVASLLVPATAATAAAGVLSPDSTKQATLQRLNGRTAASATSARHQPGPGNGLRRLAVQRDAERVVLAVRLRHGFSAGAAAVAGAVSAQGGRERLTLSRFGTVTVEVPQSQARLFAARMRARSDVAGVEVVPQRKLSLVPDDPQWTAQAGYLDAVDAPAAWDVREGDAGVKIAVVDSGVDVSHPDLAGRVVATFNAAADVAHDTAHLSDVTDDLGHGTFVAGVAAATHDNGVGIAGASMGASILAVKVADSNGAIYADAEADGIDWAVDNGANVINLSLGSSDSDPTESAAIARAISKGVLVVAAAGNAASTTPEYPAAYPGVVAVGATDAAGNRAGFSEYGSWVTVAAPGVNITGTTPMTLNPKYSMFNSPEYDVADGTSFSTPLVSAEAALLWSLRPSVSATDVRAAIVRSAHGYNGLGLGAGQVDYRAAYDALRPDTNPTLTTPAAGSTVAGAVALAATSTAPKVRFFVNGTPVGAPVATTSGTARDTWTSWGAANASYTVTAADCSIDDLCNAPAPATAVTLGNAAPAVTSPAPSRTLTGTAMFTATAPGGGLWFMVDGVRRGFDNTAPYTMSYSVSLLTNGTHTVQVRSCSVSGRTCAGPASPVVTFVAHALHPRISVSPYAFSPNGDGRLDATRVTYTLPDMEYARFLVRDAAGTVVRGSLRLGTLTAGTRTLTWDGRLNNGARAANGVYTLELDTVAGTLRGSVAAPARVDVTPPALSSLAGSGVTFFPYPDTYKDAFAPSVTLSEKSYLALTVRSGTGAVVGAVSGWRSAGRATLTWNGRTRSGAIVPRGTYYWTLLAQDVAGNRRSTARYAVYVSAMRLVARTAALSLYGSRYVDAGSTDSSCSTASAPASAYAPYGVWLANGCDPTTEPGIIAGATYRFTLPAATRYTSLRVDTYGYSGEPTHLGAAFTRWGTVDYAFTHEISSSTAEAWRTIGTVTPGGLVNGSRQVETSVLVPNDYPQNDFDMKYVRLVVGYQVLG